jgi:hypothetical protein
MDDYLLGIIFLRDFFKRLLIEVIYNRERIKKN